MISLIATVHKIHEIKRSVNGNLFRRIEFITDKNEWFKTDVCPDYRNAKRWEPIIQAGVGTKVGNLSIKGKMIDADSFPKIIE